MGFFPSSRLFLLANSAIYPWVSCGSLPGELHSASPTVSSSFTFPPQLQPERCHWEKRKYCTWRSKMKVLTGTCSLGEGRLKRRHVTVFRPVQGVARSADLFSVKTELNRNLKMSLTEGTLEFIWPNILTLKLRHLWLQNNHLRLKNWTWPSTSILQRRLMHWGHGQTNTL